MNQFTLTAAIAIATAITAVSQLAPSRMGLIVASGIVSWWLTKSLIPKVRQFMLGKKIFGFDINKKGSEAGEKPIPQCIGFSSAVAFCIVAMLLSPLFARYASQQSLEQHLAVLVTVLSTILLGFADDMLDLLWRYKLLFPFFIIIPLVSVYQGRTHFDVIYPLSLAFGDKFELGPLYLFYITCLGIYKTNTINIFAGINGLEVGQSIVAASSMLLYFFTCGVHKGQGMEKYQYSIYLLVAFLGGALALMKLNQYPSQIFIGDTFCYYAGIVLAVAAIFGEIPVVSHWFFIPQLINFLYSVPQLLGYVPCPRHRLARYDPQTDTLHPIPGNMNMLNLALRILGPTNEGSLCKKLLLFQWCFGMIPIIHCWLG